MVDVEAPLYPGSERFQAPAELMEGVAVVALPFIVVEVRTQDQAVADELPVAETEVTFIFMRVS